MKKIRPEELHVQFHKKQLEAYKAFLSPEYTEVLVGGGGSGGKSRRGAEIVNMTCIQYPGIAWIVGRKELKRLKLSTRLTFHDEVFPSHKMKRDVHYHINFSDFILTYANGSKIFFIDLDYKPNDPLYDRIGSIQATHARVEEAQEVERLAIDTLHGRLRLGVKKYNLTPTIIMTCNPSKGHLYTDFIRPPEGQKIEKTRKFIQILYTDNPLIDQKKYERNILATKNKVQIERLLHGNWEYDNTPGKLYDYDSIIDLRSNTPKEGKRYIVCDPARLGEDRAVISIREGLDLKKWIVYEKCELDVLIERIRSEASKRKIPMSRVLCDVNGLGGGVVDMLKCVAFDNNARPIQTGEMKRQKIRPNYAKLKDQCAFELGKKIEELRISDETYKHKVIEELDVICEIDADKERPRKIIGKEDIKKLIGRSPNFFDVLMMRMFYEIKKPGNYRKLLKAVKGAGQTR